MMTLPKRYKPNSAEPRLQQQWQEQRTYHFDPNSDAPVYSIDTPPATVSGNLHLGHTYSYSHADFVARFWRMNGYNVYYPMGYDDNGLPTEKLVEKQEGVRATDIGREAFIRRCLAISAEAEKEYEALWQRMGLSIDWRYRYRTIDDDSRRLAQWSFLDLYEKGVAYRRQAPSIWCPACQTAIAQAELLDLDRSSTFYTLTFSLENGESLPIATTRPELLPACVAIFVHPENKRYGELVGSTARVPLFEQQVPILSDPGADPDKGSGAVMCCTFGDTADVEWWYTHKLPLIEAIGSDGCMTAAAGKFAGKKTDAARQEIVATLREQGELLHEERIEQSVRAHERCDTPIEFIVAKQWFVRLLDQKEKFLRAGEAISWYPFHMENRYRQWVENLGWDWCISRQRYFGVTFPVWYCRGCGEIIVADEADLPVDPTTTEPKRSCAGCGGSDFVPETDVMDTWFTSSLTPQIAGQWLPICGADNSLYEKMYPFSLRPQAHGIIRTWAFYTIVKSYLHFGKLPWHSAAISGWGLAPEGMGKLSKSRGGGLIPPLEMIERYSADALRYWAASTGLGKDAIISEEKIQAGAKLVNKLWNVARFSARFIENLEPAGGNWQVADDLNKIALTPADRWILARTQELVQRATKLYREYDYATAKSETEAFFWRDLADNYLEMAKKRLYDGGDAAAGAQFALRTALLATIKLLAPILPYVTEQIYLGLFAAAEGKPSIHRAEWPAADDSLLDERKLAFGDTLIEVATAVRRYKSDRGLGLGTEIAHLHLTTSDRNLRALLTAGTADLISITRARELTINNRVDDRMERIGGTEQVTVMLAMT